MVAAGLSLLLLPSFADDIEVVAVEVSSSTTQRGKRMSSD